MVAWGRFSGIYTARWIGRSKRTQTPGMIERLVQNADIVRAVTGMYKKFVLLVTMPLLLAEYFERETGEHYSVGMSAKVLLALRI
jgi:hypothetical protein